MKKADCKSCAYKGGCISNLELHEKPFRYGGLFHNFKESAEYFAEQPHCFCCEKHLTGTLPYAGIFGTFCKMKDKALYRIELLCRECAYSYGLGVIERDGNIYKDKNQFKEDDE